MAQTPPLPPEQPAGQVTYHPKQQNLSKLRQIALYQKVLVLCILMYLATVAFYVRFGGQFEAPARIAGFTAVVCSVLFVFLLSIKLFGPILGVVLAVLTLIPIAGLIVLLVVNGLATNKLKNHGYRVGLLGARLRDFQR